VDEADVYVGIFAYRYGYVPAGSDVSVTEMEYQRAVERNLPCLMFFMREDHPVLPGDVEIGPGAVKLTKLKERIGKERVAAFFKSPEDLRGHVLQSLVALRERLQEGKARESKVWHVRVCYSLQPAPHFRGRERLLRELQAWAQAPESGDRVVSLVAVGGTGKTALAERVLRDLAQRTTAGVLVWSFYEDPRTEEFLRVAHEYFTGQTPTAADGLIDRLQTALMGEKPHLLVLDGLERVQAEGEGRTRGQLEDVQLKRLLSWLAAGQGTRTRALVTSRFPLVDLDDWKGSGYREERLDDLEPASAWAVLRGWGVKGDDGTLDRLSAPLHYHALSVAVLGSYLGKLWGGDATKAPTFDRGEAAVAEPKAAKLDRLLAHYAEKLPGPERDLLARLSTFPRGVTVETLGVVVEAGGQVAGTLAECDKVRLRRLLERVRELGLVFRYDMPQGETFSAHPFLRDFFRDLLGVTMPREIHEVVRKHLQLRLNPRPQVRVRGLAASAAPRSPTEPASLDLYEALIEHTRLAGRMGEAFELWSHTLGGFQNLGERLGDHSRGLRIVSGFSANGSPEAAAPGLPDRQRASLLADWGLFAARLGDLAVARRAFAARVELCRNAGEAAKVSRALRHQAGVELLAGRLPQAREAAADALTESARAGDPVEQRHAHAYLAAVSGQLGALNEALQHFSAGQGSALLRLAAVEQLSSLGGIWEAELKLITGKRSEAAALAQAHRDDARQNLWIRDQALCEALLGRLALPDDPAGARLHLAAARGYASRSSHVEVQLRCSHLAVEIARTCQAYDLARSEAEVGIHLADTCGFGLSGIDLRLELARVHLDAGNIEATLRSAGEALDRSIHPECQYAWGEADGLHLCGVGHARRGERELARQRLTAALAKREQLTHPGLPETREEIARLGG
jgi:hypothetical protein